MKKVILNSIFVITIAVFVSSCAAYHSGYIENSTTTVLSQANFSYVKQNIKGTSSAKYVFGIGGIARKTLVDDAKQKMLSDNPLKSNQALANLTVNYKRSSFFVIIMILDCTITADIVEFK